MSQRLGSLLSRRRLERGMTREQLADAVHARSCGEVCKDAAYFGRLESGRLSRPLSDDHLAFSVTVLELEIGWDEISAAVGVQRHWRRGVEIE